MAECTYTYNGVEYKSYEALMNHFLEDPDEMNGMIDLVFSMTDRQEAVCDVIDKVKQDYKLAASARSSNDMAEYMPEIVTKTGATTPQKLFNMPFFTIEGRRPIFLIERDKFVDSYVASLKNQGVGETKALDAGKKMLDGWDTISDDAYKFHQLVHRNKMDDSVVREANIKGTRFSAQGERLGKAIENIRNQVFWTESSDKTNPGRRPRVFENLTFSAPLENVPVDSDLKEIVCHIDFLAVRENGDVDIYNIKSSMQPSSVWSSEKKENYRYEIAMIKKILGYNGINTSNIRASIIPVQIKYSDGFETIEDIIVQPKIDLDLYKGRIKTEKYDKVCGQYVHTNLPEVKFEFADLAKADESLKAIFGDDDIKSQFIRLTARKWVDINWGTLHPKKLADGGYELTIPDTWEKVVVKDSRMKGKNEELVEWISEKMDKDVESFTGKKSAQLFMTEIEDSFRRRGFLKLESMSGNNAYAQEVLNEYFYDRQTETDSAGNKVFKYHWTMENSEVLKAANIIMMRNNDTNQVDFIVPTQLDPGEMHEIQRGVRHLLGRHLMQNENSENFTMPSTWGNIEAMRIVSIINAMAKDMTGDIRFGKLKLISFTADNKMRGDVFDFRYLFDQWGKVVKIVNGATGGKAGLKNNIRTNGVKVMSSEEVLYQLYRFALSTKSEYIDTTAIKNFSDLFNGYKNENGEFVPGLMDENREYAKIDILLKLMGRIKAISDQNGTVNLRNPKMAYDASKIMNTTGILTQIYFAAADVLRMYTDSYVPEVGDLSWLEEHIPRPETISEPSFAKCVSMVMNSISITNNRMTDYYMMDTKKYFDRLYEKAGFGKARKVVFGDQSKIFENMFVYDENGNNTFILKNPYDNSSVLKDYEREFLKDFLYELYKCKCRVTGDRLDISGKDDPRLLTKMPANYLYVPLQKASKETQYAHMDKVLKRFATTIRRAVQNPIGTLKEVFDSITDTSMVEITDKSFHDMTVRNSYKIYEKNFDQRQTLLDSRGADWFETNLENVFIDYAFEQTRCEEMNNLLFKINAVELSLYLRKLNYNVDDKTVDKVIGAIDDYVKVNVHNGTIMEKSGIYLENCMKGLRKLTSEILFGNNLKGYVRDIVYGAQANFISAATKFNTDITIQELSKAYMFVFRDSLKNLNDMGLLRQLNVKYGFSSFDYGNVSRKLKDNSGWIYDWQKWMYWTMKAPDFLNRMVLFVGRLIHDGSVKAYTLDENGNVKYDWKKDKRFELLVKKDKKNPKYNDQLSTFMSLARELNNEFPEYNIKFDDPDNLPDLPDGYTTKEIRAIKKLGEQLYGAYDKAARNKLEHMAIGHNFMFFFNFFNGITDIYFSKGRVSDKTLMKKPMVNEDGEALYFNERGELTTENTGVRAFENVPASEVGIFMMLKDAWNFLSANHYDFKFYYNNVVKNNPTYMKNYKKLLTDMSIMAIFTALLTMVVKPAYRKYKKEADPEQLVQNLVVELLYRGWSRSADFFSGPLALIKYFGDSTNPVTYDMGTKMLTDTYKLLSGKISFGPTMLSYSALYRSMQDSLKMYYREMAKNNTTLSIGEEKKREKELQKESH